MSQLDDYQVVKVDRSSDMSLEYYVQVLSIFGARPMYHFEKRKEAKVMAEALKSYMTMQFNNATEDDQKKAIQLLEAYEYTPNKKRDYEVFYV